MRREEGVYGGDRGLEVLQAEAVANEQDAPPKLRRKWKRMQQRGAMAHRPLAENGLETLAEPSRTATVELPCRAVGHARQIFPRQARRVRLKGSADWKDWSPSSDGNICALQWQLHRQLCGLNTEQPINLAAV